jgi:hypothetical protein
MGRCPIYSVPSQCIADHQATAHLSSDTYLNSIKKSTSSALISIMKISAAYSATLLGFALATPVAEPQDIDFAAYNAIPMATPVSAPVGVVPDSNPYDPATAAAAAAAAAAGDLTKRGSCAAQPAGNFPTVSPDTVAAFEANPEFTAIADAATTPAGYFLSAGYQNLNASASDPTYLTYISSQLTCYDTVACAAACTKMAGCISFNICKLRTSIAWR